LRLFILLPAWVFSLAVAGYDILFAWWHRELFLEWEMNPCARAVYQAAGVYPLLFWRAGAMAAAAALMCRAPARTRTAATVVVFVVHLVLLWLYLQ
jgi:hypothetical protein